jgi:hypothetical protein
LIRSGDYAISLQLEGDSLGLGLGHHFTDRLGEQAGEIYDIACDTSMVVFIARQHNQIPDQTRHIINLGKNVSYISLRLLKPLVCLLTR